MLSRRPSKLIGTPSLIFEDSVQTGLEWQANNNRRREIQAQIWALEAERESLRWAGYALAEGKYEKQNSANKHLEAIGQAECSILTNAIYTTFPRELRDTIYRCILEDMPFKLNGRLDVTNNGVSCPERALGATFLWKPHFCEKGICTLHYFDARYMCTEVRREFIEAWISTRHFVFGKGLQHLPDFLNSDRWEIGCRVKDFISRLKISFPKKMTKDNVEYRTIGSRALENLPVTEYDETIGLRALEVLPVTENAETIGLNALKILPVTARLIVSISIPKNCTSRQEILDVVGARLEHMWSYVAHFLPARLLISVWINWRINSILLSECGMDVSQWLDKLERHEKFQSIDDE
ncbi:hypothetical protein FB567DRAFT_127042 [Paraphoma chrysanthemicola]|uniref:Uncharacterized protein n=1 Tax=Paraphoma chrysanthemicola TaxID=798071 RepID=A0A8K0VV04_9PLEO|nr:hypothetical protein FB567DRAFT_127042 [Paraphoma chrysanthemicola]